MASEVINSISSAGYINIRPEVMGRRLSRASDFLKLAEQSVNRENLQSEALRNIEEGLDQLPDAMYENISVKGAEASTFDSEGQETTFVLHYKILDFLSFFIRRSSIKKKVHDIANKNVWFDDEDYAVIAKDFTISKDDAVHLISLLRDCFDFNGKPVFFKNEDPNAVLPYDPFALCFFMLSRYEEYLPFEKDEYGRFPAKSSLAFKEGFLKFPIVEMVIQDIAAAIEAVCPSAGKKKNSFSFQVSYDLDRPFAFKGKSFL